MATPQLIICGSIALDRIMNFNGRYRELIDAGQLEVVSVSVLVDSLEQARGGTGANIAYNLAALGEQPVLMGAVGSDAQTYIEDLSNRGVDTSHVHVSQLPTASFNVLTDSTGNQIGGFYPGAMSDADSLSLKAWTDQEILFCLAAHDPAAMRRQVEECRQNNLRLLYDPGQQVSNVPGEDLKAGVAAAEILIVNEYELNLLSQKTAMSEAELRSAVPILVVTHGENGSVISGHQQPEAIKIEAARPTVISDPTGAGDAYRAGFLYGYLRQWELAMCGRLGAVIASFALEQHGTQADLNLAAIKRRYQETYNQEVAL